jgi:hypothetical protein
LALSKNKRVKVPKKALKGDLPTTEKEWVRYINKAFDEGIQRKHKYEFQWVLNAAYAAGYQHLIWNKRTGNIQLPHSMSTPLTINRVGAYVEARHAKITKQRPIPRVMPNGNEKERQEAAKFGTEALTHLWHKIDFDDEKDSLAMQMLVFGNSFVEDVWDPFAGESILYNKGEQNEELAFDEDGEEELEEVFMGEISSKCVSPFHLIVANDCVRHIKDQDWVMKKSWASYSDIKKFWPHLKIDLKDQSEEKTEAEKTLERLASPISSSLGVGITGTKDSINSEILIKTFYMKPNYQYPGGVVAVVICNELAFIGSYPDDYGKNNYPFVHFSEKNDGVHFWQQATVERLLSLQRSYNRLRQKKLNAIYLNANPKVLLPKGSQVAEEAITDEEHEIVEYNSAVGEPKYMNPAPLPAFAREMPGELREDFSDVANQRPAIETPLPNLTAGVAMQTAAEIGEEPLGPILRRFGRSLAKVGNQQLLLMDKNYEEARMVRIVGSDGEFSVKAFKGADLLGQFDVHIEVESMFPDFRGAKRQTLIDLWDRRVIVDPNQFLKAFRYGTFDTLIEDQENLENVVWIEIEAIKGGKEPEINPFQDHATHFRILSQWMNTPEFLRLIPERKQLAVAVLQGHLQFLVQSLPGGGAPVEQQNQNAVNTPFGSAVPAGTGGNGA